MIAKYQIATHAGESFRRLSWHDLRVASRACSDAPLRVLQRQLALLEDPICDSMRTSASEVARVQTRLDALDEAYATNPGMYDEATILARALVSREHKSPLDAAARADLVERIVAFAVGTRPPSKPVDHTSADAGVLGVLVVDIPGEPDQHATLRRVPVSMLVSPPDPRLAAIWRRDHPDLLGRVGELSRGPRGQRLQAACERRASSYDYGIVLRQGLVAWSYPERLPAGVELLDVRCATALVTAIVTLSLPPAERAAPVH
jgi:hypothetical protein